MLNAKSNFTIKGKYRIITMYKKPKYIFDELWLWARRKGLINSWIKSISPEYINLVMLDTNTGLNLVLQHLQGTTVYPLEIDNISIGSGTTAPASTDTDLVTPVATNLVRAVGELTAVDTLYTEWFISDDELPTGTYTEIGLFAGTQLFTRSLISPSHTKTPGEDTLIVYEIIATNT